MDSITTIERYLHVSEQAQHVDDDELENELDVLWNSMTQEEQDETRRRLASRNRSLS